MSVTKRTRYEVLRRDNHQCRYCGATAPGVELTVDHVTPVSLGGSDDPSNLVAACRDCNAGKASSNPDAPLVATVSDDQLRWAKALGAAASEMLADRQALHDRTEAFMDQWDNYRSGGRPVPLPASWRNSVDRWTALGLPLEVLCDDVAIAMSVKKVPPAEKFSYVAGIAWNQVRELQAKASAFLEDEDRTSTAPGYCSNCDEPLMSSGWCLFVDVTGVGQCFECGPTSTISDDHSRCCELWHAKINASHFGFREAKQQDALLARYYDVVARFIDGDAMRPPIESKSSPSLPPYHGPGGRVESELHDAAWLRQSPGAAMYRTAPVLSLSSQSAENSI